MNRLLSWTSALLTIGLAAGCTTSSLPSVLTTANGRMAPQTDSAGLQPISTLLDTEKYFPLQRTFTWTYSVLISTPTGTSSAEDETKILTLSDSSGSRVASYVSKRTVDSVLVSQDTGTFTQTTSLLTLAGNGGSETIQLPFAGGATWTSGTLTAHSFAIEKLAIGSKTYKGLIAISYEKGSEVKAVRWFASGYGLVKQITRSTVNGDVVVVTSELKDARVSSVTGVVISPLALNLALSGGTGTASARVNYDDHSQDQEVLYSVASGAVATVNASGIVTPVGAGSTVLTATSRQDPSKSATISVTVN